MAKAKPKTTDAGPLDDLMPRNPLMAIAWADGLRWAIGDPQIVANYRADTGDNWQPGTTPIDRMIDDSSGAGLAFARSFAKWFNANIWGEVDGRPCDAGDRMEG